MTDAERELAELFKRNPELAELNAPLIRRDTYTQDASKGGSGRPDSTQGAKVVSQYTKAQGSRLERKFIDLWESLGCPPLQREWRFDEVRRWRFDFAHPGAMVAIELEGILYRKNKQGQTVSRHQHPKGYEMDCEKYAIATLGGWQVYRLTANMITAEWCNRIADEIRTTEGMKR